MAESEAGKGAEGRELYADGEDLRMPEVGAWATERSPWWPELGSERCLWTGPLSAPEEQSKPVQAKED